MLIEDLFQDLRQKSHRLALRSVHCKVSEELPTAAKMFMERVPPGRRGPVRSEPAIYKKERAAN